MHALFSGVNGTSANLPCKQRFSTYARSFSSPTTSSQNVLYDHCTNPVPHNSICFECLPAQYGEYLQT